MTRISRARALYPFAQHRRSYADDHLISAYDYAPIIKSFGGGLVHVSDDDYQGDTYAVVKGENGYGVLCFSWGSCSGCDALQGCNTYEELDELIDQLESQIRWFESLFSLQAWVADDESRKLDAFYYSNDLWQRFKDCVLALEARHD